MSDIAAALVLMTRHEDVVTLTLNRPAQYNALSSDMLAAIQAALDGLADDAALRCVVIAAAGRAFCAGHDLKQVHGTADEAALQALFAECSRMMMTLRALPVPVIAQVQGLAVAAGCQLVAACDLAVAAESARFAVSGINLGLFCSTPAVALSRSMTDKAALDMLLTGRFVDAEEAKASGLVNRVVADADLAGTVADYAAEISAKSPEAVRTGKRMYYAQREMTLTQAYRFAGDTMARNMMGADARAGVGGFLRASAARRSASCP